MSIHQFLSIILSRTRLFVVIFISVVSLVLVVSIFLPKKYVSQAIIAVDAGGVDPVASANNLNYASQQQNYLGTQASIVASHNAAKKVVESLKLAEFDDAKNNYQAATNGQSDGIVDWLADILLKDLDVIAGKDSNTITINYHSVDPQFAAAIANGFIDAYKNMVVESRVNIATQNEVFFKSQLTELKNALEEKQKRLSEYQKANSIIATTDERIDLENQKMLSLAAEVARAQADYIEASSKVSQSEEIAPDVLANPVIQQLTVQLVEQEKNLTELAQKEGPNHPLYKQLIAQVTSTRQQLNKLKVQYGTMQAKSAKNIYSRLLAQQEALAVQKQKVLDMKDKQTQLDILQRGIDNSQRNYDMVMQKWSDSVMQANANMTNITVLQSASAPIKPSSPNIMFNMLISIFLGLFLSSTVNYILDMLDRRVRCTDDVETMLNVPILVELSGNSNASKRKPLVSFFRKQSNNTI